jgi:hypothetical protein
LIKINQPTSPIKLPTRSKRWETRNKKKQETQNKTKQNKTKQNKTKQNKTKQNKTKQKQPAWTKKHESRGAF